MLRIILFLHLQISFIVIIKPIECININMQKEILKSLHSELSIKNVIVIKPMKFKNGVLLAKYFSRINVYVSFLNVEEMDNLLQKYNNELMYFVKTIVLINDENLIFAIPRFFRKHNEYAVSKFVWISFNKYLLKEVNCYVPYNTQLLIVENFKENCEISEIYHPSVDSLNMFERHFGIWAKGVGIRILEKDLYQRRFNMNKTILTLVYQRGDKRFVWLEFIEIILRTMNLRVHIRSPNEYREGAVYKGKLLRPEVILTPKVFDYTTDYTPFVLGYLWKSQAFLYIKYDSAYEERGISLYFRPFSVQLWYLIFISIVTSAICTLTIIIIKIRLKNFREISFLNVFYHPMEAFVNQYGGEKPITFPIRIVIITMRLIALFIVPAYSAAILTFLLVPNVKLPFTDIKGFVQDGTYKLGFSTHNDHNLWFKFTNDYWSKTAYERFSMSPNEMPKNFWEEFQMLCGTTKVALIFFGDMAVAAPCRVIKIPTPLTTVWNGLYLRDNSPYTKIFNRILKNILSSGVFYKQVNEIPKYVEEYKKAAIIEKNIVEMETIIPVLKLIGILYSIAGLLLMSELVWKRIISKCRRRL